MEFLSAIFGRKLGTDLPGYRRDHKDPDRKLVHGVLMLYTGTGGDPFHSMGRAAYENHLRTNWGPPTAERLVRLMDRFEVGECTLAFDLARVIKLARHGAGAGWLGVDASWERCIRCASRLKAHYPSWRALYEDKQAGRVQWHRDVVHTPLPQSDVDYYASLYEEGVQLLYARMPLNG